MMLYCSADGDHIGRLVGRASLANEENEVRRISSAIDSGNKLFNDWVLAKLGEMISYGGNELRFKVPVSALTDLPRLRHEYKGLVGATISVGVGVKLSEADKALLAAKLQGGDRVQLYTQEAEQLIKEKGKPKDEAAKLDEEYGLGKAEPGLNQGAHAGIKGPAHQAGAAKPTATQGDHEEGQAAKDYVEDNAVPPEMTHAAKDLTEQFHDLATEQSAKDQQTQEAGTSRDAAKAQVVKILTEMRGQSQVLDQLKQAAPQAYKAVVDSVRAMLTMAKELRDDPQPTGLTPAPQPEGSDEDTKKSELKPELAAEYVKWSRGQISAHRPHSSTGRKPVPRPEGYDHWTAWKMHLAGNHSHCSERACSSAVQKAEKIRVKLMGDALIEVDKDGHSLGKGPINKDALDKVEKLGDQPQGINSWTGKPKDARRPGERWWEELTPEEKEQHKQGVKSDLAAIQTMKFPLPAKFSGEDVVVHGPVAGFEPYKSQSNGVVDPSQLMVERADGNKFITMAGSVHINNKPLIRPGYRLFHERPNFFEKATEPLDKGPMHLPMPHATAHPHLNLPPGSTKDGKIKVVHGNGQESWVSVRAGQVMSQDGHSVSARNPNGR